MSERRACARAMAAVGLAAWAAAILPVRAVAEITVWDGIYTPAQAERGQTIYTKECASCHKSDLQGHGTTPSLSGADFTGKWDGEILGDLFEKMQTSMPADHPGRLSRAQNAAILAYILRANDFPAGRAELRTDAAWLANIRFTSAKPK